MSTTAFGPFRLDLDNQCVRRDGREIALTPKAFAVLRCLLDRRGRLVSKQELLDAVWPDTVVVDAVLKVVVLEIRKALGETGRSGGFIETLHRRGYRFRAEAAAAAAPASAAAASAAAGTGALGIGALGIGALGIGAPATGTQTIAAAGPAAVPQPTAALPRLLVGRQRELAELQRCRLVAAGGRRQLVFVVGEPGAGKSSLLELFLRDVAADPAAVAPFVATGQCNAMVGPGEPYMPVLEALARLCRGPSGAALLQLLARTAPTWLLQMPWLVADAARGELERELRFASSERMVRELIEFVEALAAVTPLVLLLEDLHWSDGATLGLLAALVARSEPARCLVVATTRRPDDGAAPGLATLLAELVTSGRANVLELGPLSRAEVAALIAARAPAAAREAELAETVHRRTGGRPLFVEHVLDDLLQAAAAGQPAPARVPPSLRSLLTAQLERLPPAARTLLEAGALCGTAFAVAAVAAALDLDPLAAEDLCLGLARSTRVLGPLEPVEWPDGTVTARCRFAHELLRDVAAERVAPARARSLHQRLGERLEQAFAGSLDEAAAELAFHFAAARDRPRTVRYLRALGRTASSRLAPATAVEHLQRALALLDDTPLARDHALVASMQQELGNALRDCGDMRAAQRHYAMMAESAVRGGAADRQAEAWLAVASAASWIDRDAAAAATARARALVGELGDPLVRAHVEGQLGYWHLLLEGFRPADEAACTAAIEALRAASRDALAAEHAARHSFFSCLRSRYARALTDARAAKVTCRESGNGFDYLLCAFFGAWAALHGGQWGEMLAILHDADAVAERNGHDNLRTLFRLQRGWLHEHAFRLESARALSESALAAARAAGHHYGEMVGEVLLGYAHLGAGEIGEARCRFESVSQRLAERRVLMDWTWRMPIAHGLGECDLLGGDLTAARRRALGVLSLAGQLGDRYYLALGHRRLALVAEREGDLDGMEAALDEATRTLEGGEAPLAAFRVQATCARLWQRCGRREQAESARQAARATVAALAASLASAERVPATAAEAGSLRQALLASAQAP